MLAYLAIYCYSILLTSCVQSKDTVELNIGKLEITLGQSGDDNDIYIIEDDSRNKNGEESITEKDKMVDYKTGSWRRQKQQGLSSKGSKYTKNLTKYNNHMIIISRNRKDKIHRDNSNKAMQDKNKLSNK